MKDVSGIHYIDNITYSGIVFAEMSVDDWLDLRFLKFISQHTSAVMGVLISVVMVSRTVQWAVGPGWLQLYVEYSERAVLAIIFLYFPIRVFYDLYEELKTRGKKR